MRKSILSRLKTKKTWQIALVLVTMVLILSTVGMTAAFLQLEAPGVVNSFGVGAGSEPEILETFTEGGTVKENVKVKIKEGGDTAYFVRAEIVINLLDKEGNVVAILPVEDEDYEITMGSDWTKNGDYWYYNEAVVSGGETTDLITKCTTLNSTYYLSVDVQAQTLQANPQSMVQELWGYVPGSVETVGE